MNVRGSFNPASQLMDLGVRKSLKILVHVKIYGSQN
jgi:hypothetical protein